MDFEEKMALAFAGVVVMVGFGGCFASCNGVYHGYSDGTRVGSVVKFSRKGVAFKSWEGTMMLNNMGDVSAGAVQGLSWSFSATDPAVIEQLQQALKDGNRVEVTYRQWLIGPMSQDSDMTIVEVKKHK